MAKGIDYGKGSAATHAVPGSDLHKALIAGDMRRAETLNRERIERERAYLRRAADVERELNPLPVPVPNRPYDIECDPQVNFQLGI